MRCSHRYMYLFFICFTVLCIGCKPSPEFFKKAQKNGHLASEKWKGRVLFDTPRHRTVMNMPLDWPRINQFPEWFTVESDQDYELNNLTIGSTARYSGKQLHNGIIIHLQPGIEQHIIVM